MSTNKLKTMYILSFLFSVHFAISAYINSSYLSGVVGEHFVGIVYAIAAFVALVLLSSTEGVLRHLGNKRFTVVLLLANMLALLGLIVTHNPLLVICSFVLFIVTNYLAFYCLDIFIEHFGTPGSIGKSRSVYLTILNVGWIISPLITTYLIARGGFGVVYAAAFFSVAIMVIGLLLGIGNFKDKSYEKKPFLEMYKFIKNNQHIKAITIISFLLQFFYAWMTIYTPIYLYQHIGLGWDKIGIIFTIMLVPFVLFGIPLGRLIDKYHVHKRTLLATGTIIIALSTITISFIGSTDIALWALVFFITRIGAVMLETVSEIYFFTHVRESDASILSVYRDMTPLAYIIAPILGTLFITFFPFKYLFITLGILMLTALYYITHLKHTKNFYEAN